MAYVNKRADIEKQKAQQFGNFAGALFNSGIQAGVNEIMRIQQQKDDDTVGTELRNYTNTMESDFLTIQNTYGSDQWKLKFAELTDAKMAEIQGLDIPKRIKDRLVSGYTKYVDEFEGQVDLSIATEGVNESNRITNTQKNFIFENNTKQAANYLGVEFTTSAKQATFSKGKQISDANKTFVDGVMPEVESPFEEEPQSTVQLLVPEGATEYDKKALLLNYIAEKRWPENGQARNRYVEENLKLLGESQAKIDLSELFSQEFSLENQENWDYASWASKQFKDIETMEYGGIPLTAGQKQALRKHVNDMWTQFSNENKTMAADAYTQIQPTIQALYDGYVKNKSNTFGSNEVNQIFSELETDVPKKFLAPYKQEELARVSGLEEAINKMRYIELEAMTPEERVSMGLEDEYSGLLRSMTPYERNAVIKEGIQVQQESADRAAQQRMGYTLWADDTVIGDYYAKVDSGEIDTVEKKEAFKKENKGNLTLRQADYIDAYFEQQKGTGLAIEGEGWEAFERGYNELVYNGGLTEASLDALVEKSNLDIGLFGGELDRRREIARDKTLRGIETALSNANKDNKLTREDHARITAPLLDEKYGGKYDAYVNEWEQVAKSNEANSMRADLLWQENRGLLTRAMVDATNLDKTEYVDFYMDMYARADRVQMEQADIEVMNIFDKGGTFAQAKEVFARRGITSDIDPKYIRGWEESFKNEFVGEARKRISQLRYNNNLNKGTLAEVEQYLKDNNVEEGEYADLFYTAQEEIKTENANSINDTLLTKQIGDNLDRASLDKAFADTGITAEDNPELYAYWDERVKKVELQDAHVAVTNIIYDNKSPSELDAEIDKLVEAGVLDRTEDREYIEELHRSLDNNNLIEAQKKVDQLKKDKQLSAGQLDAIKTQYGITDEDFSNIIGIWESDLEAQNIEKFENDMARHLNEGTLDDAAIANGMDKYDIDVQDNQPLLYKWTLEGEGQLYDKVSKEYNSLDAQGNIVPKAVRELIEKHGLTYEKDGALIKTMMDEAQANLDEHIAEVERKLNEAGQGFSTEDSSDRTAVTSINAMITGLRNRTVSVSDAIAELDNNIAKLTKKDYEALYSDIVTVSTRNAYADTELFSEEIYKPFLRNTQGYMPEDLETRVRSLNLDTADFQEQMAQMTTQGLLNQHNANIDEYTKNKTYIALRNKDLDDDTIRKMGYYVPDDSKYYSWDYIKQNAGKPPSLQEIAQEAIEATEGKLLENKLPEIKKDIDADATKIQESVVKSMKVGGSFDDPDIVNVLEVLKFTAEPPLYQSMVLDAYKAGDITDDTFNKYMALDISKYKDPMQKSIESRQGEWTNRFVEFAKSSMSGGDASNFALNWSAQNWAATYIERWNEAVSTLGRDLTDQEADNLMKSVYEELVSVEYAKDTDAYIKMMNGDASVIYDVGAFETVATTESYKFIDNFRKGEYAKFDTEAFNSFLSDPKTSLDMVGDNSGMFGYFRGLKQTRTNDEVGDNIQYEVARHLGFFDGLPPLNTKDFDKEFKDYLDGLAPGMRNQVVQMTSMVRTAVDVADAIIAELPEDIKNTFDPETTGLTPIMDNNTFGIALGDYDIFYVPNEDGNGVSLVYQTKEGTANAITVKNSDLDLANQRMGTALKALVSDGIASNWTVLSAVDNSSNFYDTEYQSWLRGLRSGETSEEPNAAENKASDKLNINQTVALRSRLSYIIADFKNMPEFGREKEQYLQTLNTSIKESNELTGEHNPLYTWVRVEIDNDKINNAGDKLFGMDIRDLVKFTPMY